MLNPDNVYRQSDDSGETLLTETQVSLLYSPILRPIDESRLIVLVRKDLKSESKCLNLEV